MAERASAPKTFTELILRLQSFWSAQGCALLQGYDLEVGAGTMNPQTFLRVLGPEPWNVAYVEPSRRPADGRFGENPNRLFQHHQYQGVLKPRGLVGLQGAGFGFFSVSVRTPSSRSASGQSLIYYGNPGMPFEIGSIIADENRIREQHHA